MFNKKTCKRCKKKTDKKDNFCPSCGSAFNEDSSQDFGMLGKNDFLTDQKSCSNSILGGFSDKILNKMLGSAMRMLEKEMQKEMNSKEIKPKTNIRLMINGKEIRINPKEQPSQEIRQISKFVSKRFSKQNQEKFLKLGKKEPQTNIRRFSDKVIYEIKIPKVNSVEDISIVQLESSIEIKAIAKKIAYLKLIPISIPITKYYLSEEKLILELNEKN